MTSTAARRLSSPLRRVSRVGAMRSAGLADADAGPAVDESVEQLIAAVHHLLTDHTSGERRGRNAKKLAQQRFSMSSVVDSFERAYLAPARNSARIA